MVFCCPVNKKFLLFLVLCFGLVQVMGCDFLSDLDGNNYGKDQGEQITYRVKDIDFHLRLAPAATFPTGIVNNKEATVENYLLLTGAIFPQ